jgi:hypothetical protein
MFYSKGPVNFNNKSQRPICLSCDYEFTVLKPLELGFTMCDPHKDSQWATESSVFCMSLSSAGALTALSPSLPSLHAHSAHSFPV